MPYATNGNSAHHSSTYVPNTPEAARRENLARAEQALEGARRQLSDLTFGDKATAETRYQIRKQREAEVDRYERLVDALRK